MLSTIFPLAAELSRGHKDGLVLVAFLFVTFALVSSLVMPRINPDFPGKHLGLFVTVAAVFFVGMVAAVLVFGKVEPEAKAETAATTTAPAPPPSGTTTEAAPPAVQGDPAAGKAVFASAGCGGCHTLSAANASGTVGPNLDELKPDYDAIVHQVEVGGGPMPAFQGQLTAKQIHDVAAFVYTSTHS